MEKFLSYASNGISFSIGIEMHARLEKAVGVSEAVGLCLVPRRCLSALGMN